MSPYFFRPETVFHVCQLNADAAMPPKKLAKHSSTKPVKPSKPSKPSKRPSVQPPAPVVSVGRAVCSRSAAVLLAKHRMTVDALLARHSAGDFGQVDAMTARVNRDMAPVNGRTVSVYHLVDPVMLPYLDAQERRRAPAVVVLSEQSRTCVFALGDV